ncbi:MlaD family protein [Rhodococcus triatomae]
MTATAERMARGVVSAVRFGVAHRLGLSAIGLALVFVLGVGYLVAGVFDVKPTDRTITVRVHLKDTGGLLVGQNVALRGVPVGQVRALELGDSDVVAVAEIDAAEQIPMGGEVRVASLSLAGEQYLDFRPSGDEGPYLEDGTVIAGDETVTPVPLSTMMGNLDGMLAQVDPDTLTAVVDELGAGPDAPRKLAAIVDGGVFLATTLDSVLPQTVDLLGTSRVSLGMIGDGLHITASNLDEVLAGTAAMDSGLRTLLDRTPATFAAIDALIADNSPTMVQLLGNLTTIAQLTNLRVPALQEFFFPQYREGSTLDALGTVLRDGGIWAAVNIHPRNSCDYDIPRLPPWQADFPEPYLNLDCPDQDPSVLIRGARNAPRPPNDPFSGPDPAADPMQKADPTPIGPQSLPLTYAGPELPTPTGG